MNILKKSGEIQAYDPDKIALTLERTSDEVGQPFTEGDIRKLTDAVTRRAAELQQDPMPSGVIHVIVVSALRDSGFPAVAQAYYDANQHR